ncbi:hypothetical protein E4T56_gene11756 [Termitomyces sp. T112]|nr:hypothetical protein E4T56_gene11756 [Termitomyces sp. T112]
MTDLYELTFEHDNPCNTTIFDGETGKILYQVVTEHGKNTVTRVDKADGETIASWVWRDILPDIITIGNGKPLSVGSWLKKSLVPLKNTVALKDHRGRSLTWKGNGPGLSLELFLDEDSTRPVARFCKSRPVWNGNQYTTPTTTEPARLLMDNRGLEIQEIAVVSFLVLEKSRRAGEKSTLNRANNNTWMLQSALPVS